MPLREAAVPSFETPMNITIPDPKAYYETLNTANMHFRQAAIPAMERPETAPPESGKGEGWLAALLRLRFGFKAWALTEKTYLFRVPYYGSYM